jgi:hypothetical protein
MSAGNVKAPIARKGNKELLPAVPLVVANLWYKGKFHGKLDVFEFYVVAILGITKSAGLVRFKAQGEPSLLISV